MAPSRKKYIFTKSPVAMAYLAILISVLSIVFYLVMRKSQLIESTVFGTLIVLSISFALTKKLVFIDRSNRTLEIIIDFVGFTLFKVDARIPSGSVVQLSDEYQNTGQGHSACWLSVDVMKDKGGSVLPLPLQKKLSEQSSANRKKLVEVADYLADGFGLKVNDLRSSRYRD